ncbi:PREDICTED: olfactory receptor 2T27-like [Elephantulus edwardii]|uniref:olfactory receptor 2T27-like n=1 Tax=Elephantulus edwardii TaxID=28737 RepID=UPI0003F0E9BE|nr:PREDICTED: olfactory receptor 2T27-like [Elephantulus edwardii]
MPSQSNQTLERDFILLNVFNDTQVPWVMFILTVLALFVTLFGNTTIIILIRADSRLHNPMYFLLSQLSTMDILYISTFVPKMAFSFLSGNYHISFVGCGAQLFLFMTLVAAECLLLAVMAYDRYVAICHPLRYTIFMRPLVCVLMVVGCWSGALLNAFIHVVYTLTLPYCMSREIHNFFCEIPALLKLACADTSQYEKGLFVSGVIFLLPPISAITVSYGRILSTVLRIGSSMGLRKTLATCSSHMAVVSLFYGAAIIKYLLPKSYHSAEQDVIVSVFYTILTPMLNPLIYSLRNKDVARALRKVLKKQK